LNNFLPIAKMKRALIIAALLWAIPMLAQSNTGELRLTVTDPAGLGVKSTVELISEGNEYRHTFTTDDQGNLDARRLPYGIYQFRIRCQALPRFPSRLKYVPRFPWIVRFR
jgi:hypothetical protein